MHSCHATTATQEELDALTNKSSLRSLTTMPTTAAQPTLKTSAKPDAPLPDAPATAPVSRMAKDILFGALTTTAGLWLAGITLAIYYVIIRI
jgi:hypothetical protein